MQRIVEIKALPNGAHNNQAYHGVLPDGWAIIPDDMELPNFPFGEVEAEAVTHYRDVEKVKTVPVKDEEGNPVLGENSEPIMEQVYYIEQEPYTVMTMTKWTAGEMPEPVQPSPAEEREKAYNTQPIIEWDGEMLTVTQAAQKWQYYAAEGSEKADELQALIAEAKQTIREQFPGEEG